MYIHENLVGKNKHLLAPVVIFPWLQCYVLDLECVCILCSSHWTKRVELWREHRRLWKLTADRLGLKTSQKPHVMCTPLIPVLGGGGSLSPTYTVVIQYVSLYIVSSRIARAS